MQNAKFNCIAILDAIPEGELSTARTLDEELRDHKNASGGALELLRFRYFKIETEQDLEDCLTELIFESQSDGLIPWLHLEGHGLEDKSGFMTAKKIPVAWTKFNELITPLNISTQLNLVLVLASCYGAYYIQSLGPSVRSPILALIGPVFRINAGDVVRDFKSFYINILENFSLGKAAKAIARVNDEPLYYATNAEELFMEAWRGYRENYCSNKALKRRALEITLRLRRMHPDMSFKVSEVKKLLRAKEPEFFDKYRDIYFQCDINPGNRVRFPLTYPKAIEYVAR